MRVIKLGGSLLGSPELVHWLKVLVKNQQESTVIVPGGGLFADAVREAQKLSGIHDDYAHRLAVLAMDQFGLLLAGMNPALATASDAQEILQKTALKQAAIWLPSRMVLADASIPMHWQITSDSLSAWLAAELNASELILVKSVPIQEHQPVNPAMLEKLSRGGLVDACFAEFVAGHSFRTRVLGKQDYAAYDKGLDYGQAP